MTVERALAKYVRELKREQIPEDSLKVVRQMLLGVMGTTVAGAAEDGCKPLREMLVARGGKPEATVLIYGDKLPAPSAALLNGVMSRALDYCDAMMPGVHVGSSLIPAALAAVELRGGCDGREFITALTAGAELGARMNLTQAEYNGFDPTGVAGVFSATAVAGRILELTEDQMLNALALAFNRCGGSFQSNVDGSLAVRLIQGWVAESGVSCALLAKSGWTGPANFLGGVYGYLHLFAQDKFEARSLIAGIGETYKVMDTMFKKYPSCGLTQGVTELALQFASELHLEPEQIVSAEVRLPPYAYRLVGHDFYVGEYARVNAQFSVQYCVANAFVRKASKLAHFCETDIRKPEVLEFIKRVKVVLDASLDERSPTAVDLTIVTTEGQTRVKKLDIAPGFPGNSLSDAEHHQRFTECIDYAKNAIPDHRLKELVDSIEDIDKMKDVQNLVHLMI